MPYTQPTPSQRRYEEIKICEGFGRIVGVDEAGRGPLAGPVVAAACHIPLHVTIDGIHDSKRLTQQQRENIYEQLTSHPDIDYAIHINEAKRVDEINILQATLESMVEAVRGLKQLADFVYVDGNRLPTHLNIRAEAIIKGDTKVLPIAAASIIAKVTRDRLMCAYDLKFPAYNFAKHKGYATREHVVSIRKHGPCPIHRMTFAPLSVKATGNEDRLVSNVA